MPPDMIIKTGDMIKFTIIPPAVCPTLIPPIPLIGSSTKVKVLKMPACLEGDELPKILIAPQPYISPPFITPGTVTVKVNLLPTNKTMITKDSKAVLIKGTPFTVELTVANPAMQPTPAGPVPDPVAKKAGMAEFITTNLMVKAG